MTKSSICFRRLCFRRLRQPPLLSLPRLTVSKLELKKIQKAVKKELCCKDEETGQGVLHFEGDQREAVKSFLLKEEICDKDNVMVRGFRNRDLYRALGCLLKRRSVRTRGPYWPRRRRTGRRRRRRRIRAYV